MLVDTIGYHGDIFRRLTSEHLQLYARLDALQRFEGDPHTYAVALGRLIADIRVHDRAEDETLFRILDGSRELRGHMRIDHQQHREIEAMLARLRPGDDLVPLREALIIHFADEESVVFPEARKVIDSPHAAQLAEIYEQERAYLTHTAA